MKTETSEIQEGLIGSKTFKLGLFLSLGIISGGLIQLSCSGRPDDSNVKIKSYSVTKPVKKVGAHIPICADAERVELWKFVGEVKQKVRPTCLSGLVFLPDLPMDLIAIDAPGKVSICLWNKNRCVGWVHTSDRNYQEKKKSEIPAYSAIRLMGDEGTAIIKILNNRSS